MSATASRAVWESSTFFCSQHATCYPCVNTWTVVVTCFQGSFWWIFSFCYCCRENCETAVAAARRVAFHWASPLLCRLTWFFSTDDCRGWFSKLRLQQHVASRSTERVRFFVSWPHSFDVAVGLGWRSATEQFYGVRQKKIFREAIKASSRSTLGLLRGMQCLRMCCSQCQTRRGCLLWQGRCVRQLLEVPWNRHETDRGHVAKRSVATCGQVVSQESDVLPREDFRVNSPAECLGVIHG